MTRCRALHRFGSFELLLAPGERAIGLGVAPWIVLERFRRLRKINDEHGLDCWAMHYI